MLSDPTDVLRMCCEAEKGQALFYRSLAARAEDSGDAELAERLQELHADEQHHVSRLTARLLELGAAPPDLAHLRASDVPLRGWERIAKRREREEVERYSALLMQDLDPRTRALAEEILATESKHAELLGGKWTPA